MPELVNLDLLKNPANWLIVWLMVVFAALLFALVMPAHGQGQTLAT